jgi:outer membrane protein
MNFLKNLPPLLLLATSLSVGAVELTWEDCVKYVAEANPALEAAKKDWEAISQNERVLMAGYLPKLSASTSITKIGSSGQSGSGGSFVSNGVVLNSGSGSQIATNYIASLNASQNIFNGLKDKAKVDQAEWRTKNLFWTYVAAKSAVSQALKEAFANLILAQENTSLSQSISERRESNYKLVSVRYESGRENKGSVLLAEAYMEQSRLDVIKARDSLTVAQTKLKSLMNKDYLDSVEVTGSIPLESLSVKNLEVQDLALETPAYNQAYALERASDYEITVSQSAFLPTLDLTGNVNRQGTSYFPDKERWTVALTLTVPIFDGLRDVGTVKAATLNKYAAEGRKRNTFLDLLPKMRDAQTQAKQSDIKYSIDEKFQRAASSRAEIARAKYNNGLITFEDWDIIESELITRQTNFIQSKRDRVSKYAAWENILGRSAIP